MNTKEEKEKTIKLLEKLGYRSSEAKIILYFINNETGSSREIEKAMSLKQPAVSTGTQRLKKEGIIKEENNPKKNWEKGRPEKTFIRQLSKKELPSFLERKTLEYIRSTEERLTELWRIIARDKRTY